MPSKVAGLIVAAKCDFFGHDRLLSFAQSEIERKHIVDDNRAIGGKTFLCFHNCAVARSVYGGRVALLCWLYSSI